MQKSLTGIFLASLFMFGCRSQENNVFRAEIDGHADVTGSFVIHKKDMYSVSIENLLIRPNKQSRKEARLYLSQWDSNQSLVTRISVKNVDGAQNIMEEKIVTNPEISSTSVDKIYMELTRMELIEGEYVIHVSTSGKNLEHRTFRSSIIVEHAYTGK